MPFPAYYGRGFTHTDRFGGTEKIAEYSVSNREDFEALVKKSLAVQQTDRTKKQQKRIPQITTRLERIEKVLDKLYEDNALGVIDQDRYEQMSQKYSEEYYTWKTELAEIKEQLSAFENAGGRAWSDNGKGGGIVNACHRRPVLKFY